MQYFQGFLLTGLLRSLSTIFSALFISFHVVVLTVFDMACLDTLKCLAKGFLFFDGGDAASSVFDVVRVIFLCIHPRFFT